jgi:hypothetical protein
MGAKTRAGGGNRPSELSVLAVGPTRSSWRQPRDHLIE